jgi:integrase
VGIYIDKRTKRFYIEFQYKKHRVKERLPLGTTRKDAERVEVKMKNDLMFQSVGISSQADMSFDHFIRDVFGPIADTYEPDRYKRTLLLVKAIKPFLRGKPMRHIKASDIERFKASRIALATQHRTPRKPATIEREMSIISSIFALAVANDLIDYNPCSRVKKLQFDNVQDRVLRREDEASFFANMHSQWARDVCQMVLHTGLRQNDLMRLTRANVRLNENRLVLIQGKTTRRIDLPLNNVAREICERRMVSNLLFRSPVTGTAKGSVRKSMERACERAGIARLTIRDLRRTFMTRNAENGVDTVTGSRLAGHADTRMLHRYVRSTDLMKKAVDLLVPPGEER